MKSGFTLFEIAFTLLVIGMLSGLSIYKYSNAFIHAQVAQTKMDMNAVDQSMTIMTFENHDWIEHPASFQITRFKYLTTPIPYISKIPLSPWRGRDFIINGKLRTQGDIEISVIPYENRYQIFSGGPGSPIFGVKQNKQYRPTNGIRSIGGFYVDSNGQSSFE